MTNASTGDFADEGMRMENKDKKQSRRARKNARRHGKMRIRTVRCDK